MARNSPHTNKLCGDNLGTEAEQKIDQYTIHFFARPTIIVHTKYIFRCTSLDYSENPQC